MAAPKAEAGAVEGMEARPCPGRNLRSLGVPPGKAHEWANTSRGPWRIARSWILSTTLTQAYWSSHDLHGFLDPYRRFRDATRTAGCGPACPVCGRRRGEPGAYPMAGPGWPAFWRQGGLELRLAPRGALRARRWPRANDGQEPSGDLRPRPAN